MITYFIKSNDLVKIGYTTRTIEQRVKELQTGNPTTLISVTYIKGKHDTEGYELYKRFKELRLKGEWFEYNDEMKQFISRIKNNEIEMTLVELRIDKKTTVLDEIQEKGLKEYFTTVVELNNSEEQFPVDFDEVYPLVYSDRSNALRALRKEFMEDDDYIEVVKNDDRGFSEKIEIKLSSKCLEYFIAKKIKPVFEVYRKVFHKAVEEANELANMDELDMLAKVIKMKQETRNQIRLEQIKNTEQDTRIEVLEEKYDSLEDKIAKGDFNTVKGWFIKNDLEVIRVGRGGYEPIKNICIYNGYEYIETENQPTLFDCRAIEKWYNSKI